MGFNGYDICDLNIQPEALIQLNGRGSMRLNEVTVDLMKYLHFVCTRSLYN